MVSIPCCSVFRRSARAGLFALERGLHTSSISGSCKTSADVISALERVCLCSSSGARAGRLALKRVVLSVCKFWEVEICARADWFSRSSGFTLFLCLGARAGPFALERTKFSFLTLEHCVVRSSGNAVYQLTAGHFKITFCIHTLSLTLPKAI